MKKRYLFISMILSLISFPLSGQIDPFSGFIPLGTCTWENSCPIFSIRPDTSGLWQVGTPAKPFFGTAYSPPNAMMTDTILPYPAEKHAWFDLLISGWFPNIILSFYHKYQTDTLTDGGYIEVSYDNGATWANVVYDTTGWYFYFGEENLYSVSDTLSGGMAGFSGQSDGWIWTRIQWVWEVPVRYPGDSLMFRFNYISDSLDTGKDGWIIDDINLTFVNIPGAIGDAETLSGISISPVPFSEKIYIDLRDMPDKKPLELILMDISGKEVRHERIPAGTAEYSLEGLENVPVGMYLIRFQQESRSWARKVLKN